MRLNQFQKGAIITLRKSGLKTTEILVQLWNKFRINTTARTFQRVWSSYINRNRRQLRERRGRKLKCTVEQQRLIKRIALQNRWLSIPALTELINRSLRNENLHVGRETVRKTLLKFGLERRVAARKPLLTEAQRARRLDFARRFSNLPAAWWTRVVFSDEKIFRGANNRRSTFVTRRSDERLLPACLNNSPKHAVQVHVWGAIGWAGTGGLKRVNGNLNAHAYQDQILHDLQETGPLLAARRVHWIFMQDNAPAHSAASTRAFLEERGISLLEWPGNSPDLNPIEHLWGWVQNRLPRVLPRNVEELWQLVQREWRRVPTELVRRLFNSMPRRLAAVIAAEGGTTRY